MTQAATVVLEDGLVLAARAAGAPGTALGEMVFTTGMTGYQEAVTDPSYLGQILCFTAPMIGNYGAGPGQDESDRPWPGAVIMARAGDAARHGRRRPAGAPGCASAAWSRSRTATPAGWCATCATAARCAAASAPSSAPRSCWPACASTRCSTGATSPPRRPAAARELGADGPRVVAIDCGMKESIARGLAGAGCRLDVVPAGITAAEVLARGPDGVFVSNGPGDPAAVTAGHRAPCATCSARCRSSASAWATSCSPTRSASRTEKLRLRPPRRQPPGAAHRATARVEITVQNHGYAVVADRLPDGVEVTRTSLFDGSVEGIAAPELRAWSVQYHPEASPGPRDARYMFREFVAGIGGG